MRRLVNQVSGKTMWRVPANLDTSALSQVIIIKRTVRTTLALSPLVSGIVFRTVLKQKFKSYQVELTKRIANNRNSYTSPIKTSPARECQGELRVGHFSQPTPQVQTQEPINLIWVVPLSTSPIELPQPNE